MAQQKKTKWQSRWRNRIVRSAIEPLSKILRLYKANPKNPRIHPEFQQEAMVAALEGIGWIQQVVINVRTKNFLDGHMRIFLAERNKEKTIPVLYVDLSEGEEAFALATFDPLGALAQMDFNRAEELLAMTKTDDPRLQAMFKDLTDRLKDTDSSLSAGSGKDEQKAPTLADRFIIPPFSVLDARQGYWQDRKQSWLSLGIQSEMGRGANLLEFSETVLKAQGGKKNGDRKLARTFGQDLMRGEHTVGETSSLKGGLTHGTTIHPYDGGSSPAGQTGTSIFDPVLCELVYRWFSPVDGSILDPFAGGSVRGIVAAALQRDYTGIDLRAEQVEENRKQAKEITPDRQPKWIVGDSREIPKLIPRKSFDLIFTCPPYYDLELYSEDPSDLSNAGNYQTFLEAYRKIIAAAETRLRDNRFACFVVGDIRDKGGFYRNFVSDTIAAFQEAGMWLYNEAILVTAVGSLGIRVARQFRAARKLGKTHQNVLVFCKGNPRKATQACGDIDEFDPAELFGDVDDTEAE